MKYYLLIIILLVSGGVRSVYFSDAETILNEVSQKEYKLGEYTCTDFAKDSIKKLKQKGINAVGLIGDGHMWIAIEMSPQEGGFYPKETKIKDVCRLENDNWKCLNGELNGIKYKSK